MAETYVQSLERAFDILELLCKSRNGLSIGALSSQTGLHKSTVHRLLATMCNRGYVQKDTDTFLLGYNIFDRIAKEGRKYGVLLGLISQRPSDLSETSISQCNNFLIFKMLHPRDIQYIRDMVPNITNEIVKRLRILQPGNCIGFGSAFNVPVLIKMDKPDPAPSSSSCDISGNWFIDR